MRAISLWQPWASAIAVGAKRVETRHWSTPYRGPLAIHAAKRKVVDELIYYHSSPNWQGALAPLGWVGMSDAKLINAGYGLPFGAIVATCNLIDCRPSESFTQEELHARRGQDGETRENTEYAQRSAGQGVCVPREHLERWRIMLESFSEVGVTSHYCLESPTPNGKLCKDESERIKAMIEAGEKK